MSQVPAGPASAGERCSRCGAPRAGVPGPCQRCGALPPGQGRRSRVGAALLAFFFGWTGAHKFYLGRWGWGIVYLLTGCVSWIAGLVDFVVLLVMDDDAFQRRYPGQGNTVVAVLAVALPIFCAVPGLGVVSAIAIPNFIRYQLRSKASEAPALLAQLAQAEAQRRSAEQPLVPLAPVPGGAPGRERRALSPEELAQVQRLVDAPPGALYGQYQVAVERDPATGAEAASLCAETDLDQDGRRAAWVAFLPLVHEGQVVVAAPPAPCSEQADLLPGAGEHAGQAPGAVSAASPPDVF